MKNKNFSIVENKDFGLPEFISDLTNKDRAKYRDISLGNIDLIKQGELDFNSVDHDAYYLVIRVINKGFYLLGPYASLTICNWAKTKIEFLELFNFKNAHVVQCKGKDLLKKFPGMFKKIALANFNEGEEIIPENFDVSDKIGKNDKTILLQAGSLFLGPIFAWLLKHNRIDNLADKLIKKYPTPKKLSESLLKTSEQLKGKKKKSVMRCIEELKTVEDEEEYRSKVKKMIKSRMAGSLWIFLLPGISGLIQTIKAQKDKGKTTNEIKEMLYKFSDLTEFNRI